MDKSGGIVIEVDKYQKDHFKWKKSNRWMILKKSNVLPMDTYVIVNILQ